MGDKGLSRLCRLVAVLVLVLTACAPAVTPTPERIVETVQVPVAETVVVTVEVPVEEEFPTGEITTIAPVDTPGFWPSQARKFELLHPGVKVNAIESGWEPIFTKVASDLAAGEYAYDVVFMIQRNLPQYVEAGWIQPIDLAAHGFDKDNVALYLSRYKGKDWGVPMSPYPQTWAYNEEILTQVGMEPPETWDEVTAVLRAVKDQGILEYPFILPMKEGLYGPRTIEQFCMGFGGVIADDEGNPLIDSPECKKGLEYLVSVYQEGLIDPASLVTDDFERDSAFAQGRTVFSIASTWGFQQAAKNPEFSSVMGKVHVGPIPKDGGKGWPYVTGLLMMIPTTAKNVPLAIEFMKFMVSYTTGVDFTLGTGNLTAVESVVTDPLVKEQYPGLEVFVHEAEHGHGPPVTLWYADWYTWVSPLVAPLMQGTMSVDDFIARNVEWMEEQ